MKNNKLKKARNAVIVSGILFAVSLIVLAILLMLQLGRKVGNTAFMDESVPAVQESQTQTADTVPESQTSAEPEEKRETISVQTDSESGAETKAQESFGGGGLNGPERSQKTEIDGSSESENILAQ